MPGSNTVLPDGSSQIPCDERVIELGRLLASGIASRRDVALAAAQIPEFANLLVERVDALQRGANWRPEPDCALARLGFRRTAELLREFVVVGH